MEPTPDLDLSDAAPNQRNGTLHKTSPRKKVRFPALPASLVAIALGGFALWQGHAGKDSATTSTTPAAAPVAVTVQKVSPQRLRFWNDFSGRLRAVESADIRPEVSGRITEVRFHDGQSVKAGDILFVIDPRPFEAAAARARARIASAEASLKYTKAEQARNTFLLRTRVIAQREFDQTDSLDKSSEAELLAAEADLKTAEVDVDHAYVKAPISGRVSRAELTVGNLVQNGPGAPLLTSIVSEDGIYADFEVDEQTYLATIRDAAVGNAQESQIPVELATPGEAGRVYHGFIQNFDNKLDANSGTIRARARFDNADRTLVPGMFVCVRLASSQERDLLVVPDRAIGFDQSKKFLFVVSPENKVKYREVELGHEFGGQRVVLKGLEAGERVIVDGVQRVRPDAVVQATEILAVQLAQATAVKINVR
jgi:membrane fusion protein, multidrug efflux system